MAKNKTLKRLLSLAIGACLLLTALFVPVTVSAATTTDPTIIVASDEFDSGLDGWSYTDGAAAVKDGKLSLNTGYNADTANMGYLQNVITSKETYLDQSVTVEVSCADFAAGNLPAIWLRVQESADGTKSGYVLTYDKTQFGITKWATNLSSLAMTSVATAFRATYSVMESRPDDSISITFSAVGANPTVLTVSAKYVNAGDSYDAVSFEDSTEAYQTAGTVGLSGISAAEGGTIGFDNFVYKSNCLNRTVTDDFYRSESEPVDSSWEAFPDASYYAEKNEKLEITLDTNAIAINRRRIQRPMSEAGVNQSVTVKVSARDFEAYKFPVLWLRVQNNNAADVPIGYKVSHNGYGVYFTAVTMGEDGAAVETELSYQSHNVMSNITLYDSFTLTFSATSDGNGTTTLSLTSFNEIITNDSTAHSDHTKTFTPVTDTTSELQKAGTVALSGYESSAEEGPFVLAYDYFKYTADNKSYTDMFGGEVENGWETYPDATYFKKTNGKVDIALDSTPASARRLQRPMSEAGVNQSASVTMFVEDMSVPSGEPITWPVLWLRVQNSDANVPTGYYCYANGRYLYIYKSGDTSPLVSSTYNIYADKLPLYTSFTYNFSAVSDSEGNTTLTFEMVGDVTSGADNKKTITVVDSTAELQNAGTAAVSGHEQSSYATNEIASIDNFSYTADDVSFTDDFEEEAGIGNGWEGYPSNSDFATVDSQLNFKAVYGNNVNNKLRIQRPMSEKAVNQTASITVPASMYSNNIWPFVWVRVQNADGSSAPHGYYCGKVGTNFILFKSTADGVTQLVAPYCNPNLSLYDNFVITLTAKDNGNGGTDITADFYGNVTAGGTASPITITYTDTTEELQGAGTVAISSYTHVAANAGLDVYVDDFTYTAEVISTETEEEIDILSFIKLKKYLAGSKAVIGSYADYNGDGVIDAADLVTLKKHLLGVELIGGEIIEATEMTGAASAASADYKAKIAALEDTVAATGTTYYVSADGDDSADGKTPETALKTPEAVNSLSLSSGDAVLFKRGDSFRITEAVNIVSGVSYGAYGEGEKPLLIGSLKDYADESLWTTEDGKIWKAAIDGPEAGNIVFNGGKSFGYFKFDLEDVKSNGDYCYVRNEDGTTGTVYMYLNTGNPGKYFNSIEISSTEHALYANGGRKNVKIENIGMKYFAQFGVSTINASYFNVSGCEIGYVGGGQQDFDGTRGARVGNGIEFFGSAENCVVENNYLYQIFDAAITFQGGGDYHYKGFHNFEINNNLVEYSSMNFEFWISDAQTTTDAKISNINFTNNILRFGGYGFGASTRENKTPHAFVLGWDSTYNVDQIENFNITGNTFDCTAHHFFRATNHIDMINISNNSYYQCDGATASFQYDVALYPSDVNSLYAGVISVDSNPAEVGWVNADGTVKLYEDNAGNSGDTEVLGDKK